MTWGKGLGFLDQGEDVNNIIQRLDARMDVISPVLLTHTIQRHVPSSQLIFLFIVILAISNAMARLAADQKRTGQPIPR